MIHLDTNVAIPLLNGRPPHIRERFDEARKAGTPLGVSVIAYHESMYAAAASERRQDNEEKIALLIASGGISLIDFDAADADEAADIRAHLRREGTPISPYDVLIAAPARRTGALLVTANIVEFIRVPGCRSLIAR